MDEVLPWSDNFGDLEALNKKLRQGSEDKIPEVQKDFNQILSENVKLF